MARSGGDFRQRLTGAFIQAVEEHDGLPWDKGFESLAARPFNPVRGVRYRGGNVIHLLLTQLEMGSDDPRWMTLNQANEAGYSVRKGAKASYVEYWDFGRKEEPAIVKVDEKGNPVEQEDRLPEEEPVQRKPRVFFAQVFNGADIVGLPELKRDMAWAPNAAAERLLTASGMTIEHRVLSRVGGSVIDNAAYYSPAADKSVMPPREQFKSEGDYYATALHELAHWTGHPTRLARGAAARGTDEYAKEELRAEMASMLLTSMLGVQGTVQNHARYAAHWVEQLKGDKHELFRAARDAEQIVEHLLGYAPELREQIEAQLGQNLLQKGQGLRARNTGAIAELPNFVPATAAPAAPRGVGREDPRWSVFEGTLRSQAERFNVDMAAVEKALRLVEGHFTALMDKARENGYGTEEMREMLIRNLVSEMRTLDERQQAWAKFAEKVRGASPATPALEVDAALQELHAKYQGVINKAAVEQWPRERTDAALYQAVYGDAGRRPVTPEFVQDLVASSAAAAALRAHAGATSTAAPRPTALAAAAVAEDDTDELILAPISGDESPEELGVVAETPIQGFALDDAEVHP